MNHPRSGFGALISRIALLVGVGLAFGCAAQQRVFVDSLDQRDDQALVLSGFWYPVDTGQPAPAMLLLHGCGGLFANSGDLAPRYGRLAGRLNEIGVSVLVLDSLTARGERELCTQRTGSRVVTQTNRRRDALGALQWLARQPFVDPQRIGLLGWSNGGSTVLAATNLQHPEVAHTPVQPSLAVAYYPGCESERERGYRGSAPLLLLLGAADDWTPAEPCQRMVGQNRGAPVQTEVYADAFHGFDGTAPLRLRTDVPNGVSPGQGVHVGANPAARVAAAAALEEFLQRRWRLR